MNKNSKNQPKTPQTAAGMGEDFEEDHKDGGKGLFGRLHQAIHNSRGSQPAGTDLSLDSDARGVTDDLAPRRAKTDAPRRMVVPDGVTITGSVSCGLDAEISGRIDGDVTVETRLYLGPGAVITGNVRAGSCKIEGLVEGKVECGQELDITKTGRLNSDAAAGRKITVAGQISGLVTTGGVVRVVSSGKIQGNIQAKQIFIEEGAKFNGRCTMRPAANKP